MKKAEDFTRVDQVAEWRLCAGCGACVPVCHNRAITLVDVRDQGLRPVVDPSACQKCGDCVKVCPGIEISHPTFSDKTIPELALEWGPVLEVWEGHATDPQIRYDGSSGGVTTALALFCLEKQGASGVLHIAATEGAPLKNSAVFSKCRADLLARTGSRYSPAAPCEKLKWIQDARGQSVFIGKPCDVVALRKSQAVNKVLDDKVSLAISIFCAATPVTEGTYNLLNALDVKAEDAEELQYRGSGWPGMTTVKVKGDQSKTREMTYEQSWGDILSKCAQFRCRLCPDSTGEFADISCGDPWYRDIEPGEDGWSLILVRSERGRDVLQEAMDCGYVKAEKVDPGTVPGSQKALLSRRRHLWGRLLMMRIMRIPAPRYAGFSLFRDWLKLSAVEKLRSLAGTLKRIISRGWKRPLKPIARPDRLNTITGKEICSSVDSDRLEPQCKV